MIDLKKLILPDLKMIITEYKKYISPKLTGLNKDELIKLINKFNIVLNKKYDNKIKLIKEKKEKKEPKIMTEEEKRKKEIKIEKLKIIYDKRSKEYIQKETLKEIEQLKKEGKWTEPKPEKKKIDFNFTSLYIPTKLKKSNYNDEQLNALYGDYETNYNNENMNNIATIMKEKQQYKYVYDRFKEFIEYFISVDVDKYVDDLISYDFHYKDMPKNEKTRMPFFNNDIYISNVDKTMSRDEYGEYIKKAIEDIKADIKQSEKAKKKDIKEPIKLKKEPKIKVVKEPKPKKEPKVKVVKEPKEPKVKVIKEPKPKKEPKIKVVKEPKVKVIKEPKVKVVKEPIIKNLKLKKKKQGYIPKEERESDYVEPERKKQKPRAEPKPVYKNQPSKEQIDKMMSDLSMFKAPNVDYTNDNLYGDKIFYTHNNTILKTYKNNLDRKENEFRFATNFRLYPLVCLRWKVFVESFSEDNPFDARKFTNYELNYDPVKNKNDRRPFFNSEYLHKILENIKKQKQKEIYKNNVPYYGDLSPMEILYTLFYNLFLYYRLHLSDDATKASDRTEKEQQRYEEWIKQQAERQKQSKYHAQEMSEKKHFVIGVLFRKIRSTPFLNRVMIKSIKTGKAKEYTDKLKEEKAKQEKRRDEKLEKLNKISKDKEKREPYAIKKEAPWGFNPRGQKMKNDTKLMKNVFNALKKNKKNK